MLVEYLITLIFVSLLTYFPPENQLNHVKKMICVDLQDQLA
jgi:hypothetical protein